MGDSSQALDLLVEEFDEGLVHPLLAFELFDVAELVAVGGAEVLEDAFVNVSS